MPAGRARARAVLGRRSGSCRTPGAWRTWLGSGLRLGQGLGCMAYQRLAPMKTIRLPRYMYRSVASANGGCGGAGGSPSTLAGQ
eukprot:scaffold11516_cov63-Phaeocystis_antarctica.AAC.7